MGRLFQVIPCASAPDLWQTDSDIFRCFSYAKKWDFLLIVGAAIAAIGAGVVSSILL